MAITNGYASLNELKARIAATDSGNDTVYEAVIEAASRQIDGYCGRRFYAATETRYYTPDGGDLLDVDDLVSVTSLTADEDGDRTYERTWASTDYDLEPYNAALEGKPYTQIRVTPRGNYAFVGTRRGVKIAGSFGWPAVPDAVNEACLLLAARLAKRPSAPFGIDPSGGDMGGAQRLPAMDPDVKQLLAAYRVYRVGGV